MSEYDSTTSSTLTLRSPVDLLSELPGLLGFVPEDSLVAVLLREGILRCTMRVDLADLTDDGADHLVSVARRADADSVVLVFYADAATAAKPSTAGIEAMGDLLDGAGPAGRGPGRTSGARGTAACALHRTARSTARTTAIRRPTASASWPTSTSSGTSTRACSSATASP